MGKEILPKSANFLMRNEDKGMQEDGDSTDGGGESASGGTPSDQGVGDPELHAAMKSLVAKHGPRAFSHASVKALDASYDGTDSNLMADNDSDSAALKTGKVSMATPKDTGSGRYPAVRRR